MIVSSGFGFLGYGLYKYFKEFYSKKASMVISLVVPCVLFAIYSLVLAYYIVLSFGAFYFATYKSSCRMITDIRERQLSG